MILKDIGLDEREFVKLILNEDMNQISRWGFQEHDIFHWLAFLMEEVGELSEAISNCVFRDGNRTDIEKEAIQCATLALKIATMVIMPPIEMEEVKVEASDVPF